MNIEYSVQISWSSEDNAYVAFPSELAGCMADGQTQEEALANLKVVIKEWIETANEEGRDIPKPLSIQDQARIHHQAMLQQQKQMQVYIQHVVEETVSKFVQKVLSPEGDTGWPSFHGRGAFQVPEEYEAAGRHKGD